MSLPINNGNLGSSSPSPSTPVSTAITVAYPPPNYHHSDPIPPLGVPFPRATAFPVPTRITTVYEFNNVQPSPNQDYNFVNSGTANNVSFHGWLNDGARTFFISQHHIPSFGTPAPRAPMMPFFNAMAPSSYEGPSTRAPLGMAASSSSRGPLVRQITVREHRCHECGRTFPSGPALGGHASHHSRRRRLEHARALRRLPEAADP